MLLELLNFSLALDIVDLHTLVSNSSSWSIKFEILVCFVGFEIMIVFCSFCAV